MSASKRVLC